MEKTTSSPNPLKQYFRQFKMYIRLPSGNSYYPAGTIDYTESGEVGIMPMTGRDELILKNPDALLNGEALIEVIRSCVPSVQNPKLLLNNDIDALIAAIRYVTYDDKLETEIKCPNCNHQNLFKMDLQYSLENMEYLETEYSVRLETGLLVYVKPYGFTELLKGLHVQLEQNKLARNLENDNITEEQRLKLFAHSFKEMATMTFQLTCSSVVKVVNEKDNLEVVDAGYIKEFLMNIDKKSVNLIADLIKEINQIGIRKTFTAVCEKCNHSWPSEIDFNPVNFS